VSCSKVDLETAIRFVDAFLIDRTKSFAIEGVTNKEITKSLE
jgi:hypothetical protein